MAGTEMKSFCRLAARLLKYKNSGLARQQLPLLYCNKVYQKCQRSLSCVRWMKRNVPFSLTSSYVVPINGEKNTSLQTLRCATTQSQSSDRYTFKDDLFRKYLDHLSSEYDAISKQIIAEEIKMEERHIHLRAVTLRIQALYDKVLEIEETEKLIDGLPPDETEMTRLAAEELDVCREEIRQLEKEIVEMLIPDRSADENDVILELTAGVGGQEAMLFCAEIFQMYRSFASYKGWGFQEMTYETSETGGVRRASASISGAFVYRFLKFEGGVHRVQRVPKTEKAGRVHTSTMTVAVLPQPTEIDVKLNPKDLQIETCRASGKGGQHVNTTDSAVRILHLPTGIFAECQQERSQIKNKDTAMKVLKSRIYQKFLDEQTSQQHAARKFQVGTAGRSEKIRTYNFSQDRITDHRLNRNLFSIDRFLNGKEQLDNLLCELLQESRLEILEEILTKFREEVRTGK